MFLLAKAPMAATRGRGRRRRPVGFVATVLCLSALVAGCSDGTTNLADESATPAPRSGSGAAQVERYASDNPGSVNIYWLSVPGGLVVVDSGRALSEADPALAEVRRTGRSVVAIVITHSHPDHVGGVGLFSDAFPDAPIYASEDTIVEMREDPLGFFKLTRELHGSDYAAELTLPDQALRPDEAIEVGGLRLETAQFGPGESEHAAVYYEPTSGALFTGDLINNGFTPAMLEGHTCGWLTVLDQLGERFPKARTVYPGHGAPGDPTELIDQQRTYLQQVRTLVRTAVSPNSPAGSTVTSTEQKSVIASLQRTYPDYPQVASVPNLVALNVPPVARELAAEDIERLPRACRES